MPTALLTGANGFTGKWMSTALSQRGVHVIPLMCDLTNKEAVREAVCQAKPDWVIHLAALSFIGESDSDAFYRVNVLGTLNLLEAIDRLPHLPTKVLVASSANIYGTPWSETLLHEGTIPAPVNHYACSKLVMEHMIRPWFDRLPMIITRPFNYTGLGQDDRFLIPKIVAHFAKKASFIELGNLDVSRDFSDVRDVVAAYIALLESSSGVTVNVCRGIPTSLRSLIDHMNVMAGYEIDIRVNPLFVRKNEIPMLCGDNRMLQTLIGDVPVIPIEQTLLDMFAANKVLV